MLTKEQIIKKTLECEGGYTKAIPGDKGGETYRGIARNFFPNWSGWKKVDSSKPLKQNAIISALEGDVIAFYEKQFYIPSKCGEITNDFVKMHLYDMAVNAGIKNASKILQKAINKAYNVQIAVDGVIGKGTLSYANKADKMKELEQAMLDARIAYYKAIGTGSKEKFLKAWVSRANNVHAWVKQHQ